MTKCTSILFLAALIDTISALPIAWVVEAPAYALHVKSAASGWRVEWCGPNGYECEGLFPAAGVRAVVGRADAINLTALPDLELVQSGSWYPIEASVVPETAAITNFDIWPDPWYQDYSVSNLGEFIVAAIFHDMYGFARRSRDFLNCAFADNAPAECDAASHVTEHKTMPAITVGVLGYGRIGYQVTTRMAALGADVVATKHSGPFEPTPPELRWLSNDNDRLFREADVVVVTAAGSVHDLVNATSLGLMKEDALLVPITAGSIDFVALEAALAKRPAFRAVLDVWPSGCWNDESASCGPPYGKRDWPASPSLAQLPNVFPLPGMAMRDTRFWQGSAANAASNLEALLAGEPLQHVVRNATRKSGAVDHEHQVVTI